MADDAREPREVELGGLALPPPAPVARVDPLRLDLGPQPVGGRSGILTVTILNSGSGRLLLGRSELDGPAATDFYIVPGSCEGAPYLAPGSRCTIGVRFVPSVAGPRRARLVVHHNAANAAEVVELSGVGLSSPGPDRR